MDSTTSFSMVSAQLFETRLNHLYPNEMGGNQANAVQVTPNSNYRIWSIVAPILIGISIFFLLSANQVIPLPINALVGNMVGSILLTSGFIVAIIACVKAKNRGSSPAHQVSLESKKSLIQKTAQSIVQPGEVLVINNPAASQLVVCHKAEKQHGGYTTQVDFIAYDPNPEAPHSYNKECQRTFDNYDLENVHTIDNQKFQQKMDALEARKTRLTQGIPVQIPPEDFEALNSLFDQGLENIPCFDKRFDNQFPKPADMDAPIEKGWIKPDGASEYMPFIACLFTYMRDDPNNTSAATLSKTKQQIKVVFVIHPIEKGWIQQSNDLPLKYPGFFQSFVPFIANGELRNDDQLIQKGIVAFRKAINNQLNSAEDLKGTVWQLTTPPPRTN